MSPLYCLLLVGFLCLLETISVTTESPDGYTAVEPTDECVIEAINAVEPDIVQYFHDKHPEYNSSKIEPPYAAERKLITPHVTLYYRIHFLIEPIDSRVSVGNVTVYIEKDRIDNHTIFTLDKVIVEIVEPVTPVPGTLTPEPVETTTPRAVPSTTPKPVPTTTSTPVPITTPRAVPTTSPTPVPTTTPKPVPTTTPTPVPTTTPTPVPTTTPKPVPTTTPKPVPTTTPTPVPTTTPTPVPTTTPTPVPTTVSTTPTIQPVVFPVIRIDPTDDDFLASYTWVKNDIEQTIRRRNFVSYSIMTPFLASKQTELEGANYCAVFSGVPADSKVVPNETFIAHYYLPNNEGFSHQLKSVELYDPLAFRFPPYPNSSSTEPTKLGAPNSVAIWNTVEPTSEEVVSAFDQVNPKLFESSLDIYNGLEISRPFIAEKTVTPLKTRYQVAFSAKKIYHGRPINFNFTAIYKKDVDKPYFYPPMVNYYHPETFEHPRK